MRFDQKIGMERPEAGQSELEKRLEAVADGYRSAFGEYGAITSSILDRNGFEDALALEKEELVAESEHISSANIDIWKLANKGGTLDRLHYPGAETGDLIHAVNWQELVRAASEKVPVLKASELEAGIEGIRFLTRSSPGEVLPVELSHGRAKAQGKEDFPVAVRIPRAVSAVLRRREQETGNKIMVERSGATMQEGYISAAQEQGLPLLLLEFGLPDGRWHTFLDLLDTPEVRQRIHQRTELEQSRRAA